MQPEKQVIVVEPGFFSALAATVVSVVTDSPVRYVTETKFCYSYPGRLWRKVSNARPITFEDCDNPDCGYFYGDRHATAGAVCDWICKNSALQKWTGLFQDISDPEQKLETIVRSYIDQECRLLTHVLGFVSGLPQGSTLAMVGRSSLIQRRYLLESGFPVVHIRPPDILSILGRNLSRLLTQSGKKIFRRSHPATLSVNQPVPGLKLPGRVDPEDAADSEVLFFPHQTVSYGGLFYKDQFYSNEPSSPFHPSQLMHVELDEVKTNAITPALVEYYSLNNIHFCVLPKCPRAQKARLALRSIFNSCRKVGPGDLLFPQGRYLTSVMARANFQYTLYRQALANFRSARLALIGYEVLFPKLLSLALEARKIRTIASQERFHISVFFENWNYLVHTYFCSSPRIAGLLKDARYIRIEETIPTGFVRSDLLYKYRKELGRHEVIPESSAYQKLAVVFDAPVFADYNVARLMYVSNWKCNKSFYRDIIKLATKFHDTLFVIRGKDILWLDDSGFSEIKTRLEETANVRIDKNYDQYAFQYQLAAVANLVISKYSSIGDECLSADIPTIFHDYTVIQPQAAYQVFDYDDIPVFAHDYSTLENKTRLALENGHYLTEPERKQIAVLLNGGIADGMVRERIQTSLHSIYGANSKS